MRDIATPATVLSAMITPAVLISAAGTLVLWTSNRLSRVVDRIRVLVAEAKAVQSSAERGSALIQLREAERRLITDQLLRLSARVRLLVAAMTVLYMAIGLFVATSIAIGAVALFQWQYSWVAVVSGLAGAGAFTGPVGEEMRLRHSPFNGSTRPSSGMARAIRSTNSCLLACARCASLATCWRLNDSICPLLSQLLYPSIFCRIIQ
jgi:hypothetical protein